VITGEMLEQYATLFQAPTAREIDLFDEPIDRASRS
jgi:hypothetical protein